MRFNLIKSLQAIKKLKKLHKKPTSQQSPPIKLFINPLVMKPTTVNQPQVGIATIQVGWRHGLAGVFILVLVSQILRLFMGIPFQVLPGAVRTFSVMEIRGLQLLQAFLTGVGDGIPTVGAVLGWADGTAG